MLKEENPGSSLHSGRMDSKTIHSTDAPPGVSGVSKIRFFLQIELLNFCAKIAGLSSLGVPGVPWHSQILADQLTLFQPGGSDYAHLITTDTPGFSDLPTALNR